MVYTPMRQMLTIDTSRISSTRLRVSIYDPAACTCTRSWEGENKGRLRCIPGRQLDSFIVIDAVAGR